MKQLKAIVAIVAGLFAFTSVQAGELSVTGTMQATYQSNTDVTTGNPIGMNTDLTFSGATDTDFGTATWTLATDGTFLGDSGADHTLKIATDFGTIGVGNSGDAANAVDDITPTAFEEANGSGSGSYSAADFGSGMDGSMSLSYGNGDLFGTGISVAYNYYPKLDGATNNEKGSSADTNAASSSAQSVNVGIPVAGLPLIGDSPLGAMKITLGYEESDSRVADSQPKEGGTVAATVGNNDYLKTTMGYNTGLMENGLSVSALFGRTAGDGYVQGTPFEAYNYFVAIGYRPNDKHDFQFMVTGAPQQHFQRGYAESISNYIAYGNNGVDPNIRYNSDYGYRDGKEDTFSGNFYHKPKAMINWDWKISDKSTLSSVVYASLGRGGSIGSIGRINGSPSYYGQFKDANGHVRFDDIVA